jgi:hypothetical protein
VSLALLQKQLDNVDPQFQWLSRAYTVRGRGAGRRLAHVQSRALANRDDLSNQRIPVEHGYAFASSNGPEMLAQSGFEIGYSHLFHDYSMTRNSHLCKQRIHVYRP